VRRNVSTLAERGGLIADGGTNGLTSDLTGGLGGSTTGFLGSLTFSPSGRSSSTWGDIETGSGSFGWMFESTLASCETGCGFFLSLLLLEGNLIHFAAYYVSIGV
jgi:hypothetical protein